MVRLPATHPARGSTNDPKANIAVAGFLFVFISAGGNRKGTPMPYRTVVSFAAAAALGVACISTQALAFRGGVHGAYHGAYHGGVHHGAYHAGVYHGGAYRGAYWHPGVAAGAAVGAAAIGAAVAAPHYYNYDNTYDSAACGHYPNPPCY